MVEVAERIRGAQPLSQILAGYDLALPLDQRGEDLKRLVLELELYALLPQFAGLQVHFKDAEPEPGRKSHTSCLVRQSTTRDSGPDQRGDRQLTLAETVICDGTKKGDAVHFDPRVSCQESP